MAPDRYSTDVTTLVGLVIGFAAVFVTAVVLAGEPAIQDSAPAAETKSPEQYVIEAEEAFAKADIVAAIALLRVAAAAGHIPAQVQLAYHLDYAEEDEEALHWYLTAAQAGDTEAQFVLGKMYAAGEGTEPDAELAFSWYERAADQGHISAIRVLARTYEVGSSFADISYDRAVKWLEAGVERGDLWTTQRLSDAYRRGDLGLRIDREKAAVLSERAARIGNSDAQDK